MFLWLLTFYQTGPNGLFIFYQVFNLILQSAKINQQQLIIITYSENGIKKLGQLLGIVSNRSERSNKIKFE